MNKFKRMQSSRLEKFAKGFIVFVGIVMIVALVGYFIKNPDSIGSLIYKLIIEIIK